MQIQSGDVFVRRAGDTMTGPLTISASGIPLLVLNASGGGPVQVLQVQNAGALKYSFRVANADPLFSIADAGPVDRLTLNMATGMIGTALMPLTGIGDSGSVTVNGVVAGANGSAAVTPSGFTAKTSLFYIVRNSVAAANDGGGYSCPVNQTDLRSMPCAFNSDVTTTIIPTTIGAGIIVAGGKNTNAGVANLTFEWAAVGR